MNALPAGLAMMLLPLLPAVGDTTAPPPGPDIGIGVVLYSLDHDPVIEQTVPGQSASRHGLKVGDHLVRIDGKSTHGLDLNQVAAMLRGAAGTHVTVVVHRPGEIGTRTFHLRRQIVTVVAPDGPGASPLGQ